MDGTAGKEGGRGMRVLSQWVGEKEFLVGGKFGLADVAAGSLLGYMKVSYQGLLYLL